MDTNPRCRVPLASLVMIGVALIVMSPPQSVNARSNPWYAPYSRYTPYDRRTPYTPTRTTTTCGDAIVQKPNSSGVQEVCDSGTNNGKAGYCDKSCSCMMKAWYGDNDGDGFGSPYTIASCTKPAGKFTDKPGDWNDSLATMYPGAPELCDGLDNNQNNAADEGIQIDDSNLCTDDFCMGGKVYHSNNKKSCNDNNACTNNDACALGKCGGTPVATTATYSEWGVCQANSIQTRTVTFNPPGCGSTAGLLLAQKCAPPQPSPPQPPAPFWPGQKKLAVGSSHICAFSKNGKLQCWGSNKYGQLGNGKQGPDVNPYAQDVQFSPGDVPMSVAAGGYKTCSPLSTGAVKCWGDNATTPTAVAAVTNAKAVVVGYGHACALLTTGTVKCWGDNKFGQLGDGTLTASTSNAPVDVKNLSNVIDAAVGQNYTCALIKGGSVKCWGNNEFGQLGNNSQINSVIPVTVLLTKPASSIIAGGEHTCALMSDLTVQCWGWNGLYQQGPKKYSGNNLSPVTVEGLNIMSASELALGYGYTCVLGYSGSWVNTNVLCVGDNKYGQVGAVSATVDKPTKVPVPNIVTSMAAGGSTVCAVILNQSLGTSSLQCWGEASHGELGNDPTQQSGLKSSQISYPGGSYTLYYAATPTVVPNASVGTPTPPPPPDCGVGLIWDTGSQLCACPSGKKWDTTGKQCVAYTGNAGGGIGGGGIGGGGSGTPGSPSATEVYWVANKPKVDALMAQLTAAAAAVVAARTNLQTDVANALEPIIKAAIESKGKQPAPKVTVVASKAAYDTALTNFQAIYGQLQPILISVMKQNGDYPSTEKIRSTLTQAAAAYLNTLLTASVKLPISDPSKPNCKWGSMENQLIYKLAQGKPDPLQADLNSLINTIQCLPLESVTMLDEALATAIVYTNAMVKKFHPLPYYSNGIQDHFWGALSPVLINIYDRTRSLASHSILQQYADRVKTLKFNSNAPAETGVSIIPGALMLYNPASKKPESVNLVCGNMTSPDMVWNDTYKCVYYPNFIKTMMDPVMNKENICPFWDTTRLGKACQKPVTWLDGKKIKKMFESFFISTAYADEIGSCVDCSAYEKILLQTQEASTKPPFAQGYNSKGEASYVIDQACHDPTDYPDLCGKKLACPNGTKSMGGSGYEPGWQGACWANKICIAELKLQHCKTAANPFSDCGGTCGDGVVHAGEGEECDDGKDNGIYCCSKTCKRELPTCGNGILDGKTDKKGESCEKCDDGNNYNGDGCTHVCEKEPCLKWKCGNKIKEGPEDCDDGNNKDGDGCSNYCKNEISDICGNGKIDPGEQCDDGNKMDTDACTNVCKTAKCGDGIKRTDITDSKDPLVEECDFGTKNGTIGGSCQITCKKVPQSCYESCMDDVKTGKISAPSCKTYFDKLDESKVDGCKISLTPWDSNAACKLTPYKKGDPCWKRLQFDLHNCQNEPELGTCIQKCKEENPWFVPPSMQNECKDTTSELVAIADAMAKLNGMDDSAEKKRKELAVKTFNDHFSTIASALSTLVGVPFPELLLQEARDYALDRIASAKPCAGADLTFVQTNGGSAVFTPSGILCENPEFFDEAQYFIVQNAQTLAHEATHAALSKIWQRMDISLSQYVVPGCGLDDYIDPRQTSPLDHWLLDFMEPLGILNDAKTPWANSSTGTIYDNKVETCRAILNNL